MKGLELAKAYFEEYKNTILESVPQLSPFLAFGFVGSGSECYCLDDDISTDHDFEPGFCIFVPENIDRRDMFLLERAYAKLPKEFLGYKRSILENNRHGVITIEDFYKQKIGNLDYESVCLDWFRVPEHFLSEATNGEVFLDNLKEFSSIREKIKYYPEDIRLKKLAGSLMILKQSGIYNYQRCIQRSDTAAAQLSIYEYVKSAIEVVFLLNKKYKPYYKLEFRYLNKLDILSELSTSLEYLISTDNTSDMVKLKADMIEDINNMILDEVKKQGLSKELCYDLENNANSVNNQIKDANIRNLDILYAV